MHSGRQRDVVWLEGSELGPRGCFRPWIVMYMGAGDGKAVLRAGETWDEKVLVLRDAGGRVESLPSAFPCLGCGVAQGCCGDGT